MVNLFEAAATNPALMTEVVDAIASAATEAGADLSSDAIRFVRLAAGDGVFKEALQSRLRGLAAARGLELIPETPASSENAAAILTALQQLQKDNPTQVPVSTPIVFIFVAAALMFAPSAFRSVGGTIFGADVVSEVEGIVPFQ
jgi:hypothetical protein